MITQLLRMAAAGCLLLILWGCYEDEALDPTANLQVFYVNDEGEEVPYADTDSVSFDTDFVFRSTGTADNMIIWTGDRIIDFTDASFEFTAESYPLMDELGVADDIIDALRVLDGEQFGRELDLVRRIRRDNLFDINRYFEFQNTIREAIFKPVSGAGGEDSLRFVVNHVYQDFLEQEERGYYGVNGQVMQRTEDGFELNKGGYPRPGTFEVTVVAVGIGRFGAERKEDIVSQTIELTD